MVKNLEANAGDIRDSGSISGSERAPGGGHGKSLQHSCLEIPKTEKPGEPDTTEVTLARMHSAHSTDENY